MKNLFFTVCFILLTGILTAQVKIKAENTVTRDVKSFHAISVTNALDLYLSQGNEESLAVSSSDADYISNIKTEVKNGVLKIWVEQGKWRSGNKNVKVFVSFNRLNSMDISGACNVYIVDNIKTEKFKLDISGASNLKGKIVADDMQIEQSGASDININGKLNSLKIETSGASNFKGYELETNYCDAKLSGASQLKLSVLKELSGSASGASSVLLMGEGDYSGFKTSGASSIKTKTN